MALTSIGARLTPSVPIEITFGAQPIATGKKFTTIFGHRAASGGTGLDYNVYTVVNVGDAAAAKAEVDGLAGTGSQLGLMAAAFVNANVLAGRSNFPAFRVVLIPSAQSSFGPSDAAITAVKFMRSDMFVSCYPASDTTNLGKLQALAALISGPDRDLQGQFGSFVTVGSLDVLSTAIAYDINDKMVKVAYLQDTNTAAVSTTGTTVSASQVLTALATVAGIYPGATVSGTGIAAGSTVLQVLSPSSVKLSLAATASASAIALTFQNVVSQPVEIVAAAHAAGVMSSAFPYNPLQGVIIGGLIPPQKTADWVAFDPNGASEQALSAGLSPLTVLPGNDVAFIRTRTTWVMNGLIPVTAYFDWQDLVTLNDFRESCFLISQNPPFNNNPGGTKASAQVAALFKDEILREAQSYEDQGAFQAVKSLAPQFVVQNSTTSRGRFDFKIPVNVLPGLYVIAGNIEAVTTFDFTL